MLMQKHTYKVKIINPQKKSDVIVRQLHHFQSRFESVLSLHIKLIEEFKDQVPDSVTFGVGYYEGQQHSKIWIVCDDDLKAMYKRYPHGEITLWCDGRGDVSEDEASRKRKRDEPAPTRRQEKENEIDNVFTELKQKHDNYDVPKLRLWARMIASKLHDDMDKPLNIPAFDSTPKRPRAGFSDALSGAAVAFANALHGEPSRPSIRGSVSSLATGVSPGKSVELRMKNLDQLRCLQRLYDDGVLSQAEYTEQKDIVLQMLKKF